ncbi:alpha/beta hydrolase-fold protein [Flammeovirga sp. SubArs3]|uniref:alpha/beta hydrolase-fold protein n=1 Tax=Flammeovirga sp. SubArs3 TaxID=2995316 RepID=UPI00248B52D1|nr:alpha/beta hydrolase-fold protein [Flammeovirga sp. SubArs3]
MSYDTYNKITTDQYYKEVEQYYYSHFLQREVKLSIFLPKIDREKPFKALFVNDGQDMEAVGMLSTLNYLYDLKMIGPMVVIGIHCSPSRIDEYGCIDAADYMNRGDKAEPYSRFVVEELIPFIRKEHNITKNPQGISFAGFSLGGLSALDIAWHYPNHFSKVGVFSGSFWWRDKPAEGEYNDDIDRIMHRTIQNSSKREGMKFWLQTGTHDETSDRNNNGIIDSIDDTLDIIRDLKSIGYNEDSDITYVEINEGEHNFYTWSAVLPSFLTWLFDKSHKVEISSQQKLARRRHTSWFQLNALAEAPEVDIIKISDRFDIPQLGKKRAVWALLPKGWESYKERYPVMYLHDAQNLFDKNAPYGMWGIHQSLSEMIKNGQKMMVIAIDHGEEERIKEFSPFELDKKQSGGAKKYINFIIDTLVPYINRNFPSKQGREFSGIGGSSMGGLVSLFSGLYRPESFKKYMIFSPSLWYSKNIYSFAQRVTPSYPSDIYFYSGGQESENLIDEINLLREILVERGFSENNLPFSICQEADHSEAAWGKEFPKAMQKLFFES